METLLKSTVGESELAELKKEIQTELVTTERKIFELETQFLEEVACNGNLLRRWTETGCMKLPSAKSAIYKKKPVLADRVFSLSSMSSGVYKLMEEEQSRLFASVSKR